MVRSRSSSLQRNQRQRQAAQERAAADALFGNEFANVHLAPNPPAEAANLPEPEPPQNDPPDVAVIPRAANAPPYIKPCCRQWGQQHC